MPDTPASAPATEFWFDFASGYAHFEASRLAAVPGSAADGPLAAKVSWQIGRITLLMCGCSFRAS